MNIQASSESHWQDDLPMAEFPRFIYSKGDVKRAGKALARTDLLWDEQGDNAEIREAFGIAYSWRDSHAYPMRSMRYELMFVIRALDIPYVTAARLKRMSSIRKKLRKLNADLSRIQDLGGCRAILPSMGSVQQVIEAYKEKSRHHLLREYNYIASPKPDGYRSYHLVFAFRGKSASEIFEGRHIEVQVRTRVQHSWATAVEAVGLIRNEDLKGGIGNSDWLRLFRLMSAELALAEDCPIDPDLPPHSDRIVEIKQLNERLEALDVLENSRQAFRYISQYSVNLGFPPKHFMIEYNNASREVRVYPFANAISATEALDRAENSDLENSINAINRVLVEVDKVGSLRAAYPNYFGDVELFSKMLFAVTQGKPLQEYILPPQPVVVRERERADPSWLYGRRRRRWRE